MQRFYSIGDHGVPEQTNEQLRAACTQRGIEFVSINARSFDFSASHTLESGALLYRPAVSQLAVSVEQHVFHEKLATFYKPPRTPFTVYDNQVEWFSRAGLQTPKTIAHARANHALLKAYVDYLEGFPLVCKIPGGSGGIGVMRIDSFPSLLSVLDQLDNGQRIQLSQYIPQAIHWRVIVVGDQAVAAYTNEVATDDFRSFVADSGSGFSSQASKQLSRLAVKAVSSLNLIFGGVDLLETSSGDLYLLESNFPCFFAHPMEQAGIDVAGFMVDELLTASKHLMD